MSERWFIIIGIMLAIIGIPNIIRSTIENAHIDDGIKLTRIQHELEVVTIENNTLRTQILHYEAYTTIEQEARAFGFVQGVYYRIK